MLYVGVLVCVSVLRVLSLFVYCVWVLCCVWFGLVLVGCVCCVLVWYGLVCGCVVLFAFVLLSCLFVL